MTDEEIEALMERLKAEAYTSRDMRAAASALKQLMGKLAARAGECDAKAGIIAQLETRAEAAEAALAVAQEQISMMESAGLSITDALRSAEAALAARASGWRDIASAPKNGARVLVYGAGRMSIAVFWGELWYACVDGDPEMAIEPTHWMPLPSDLPEAPQS